MTKNWPFDSAEANAEIKRWESIVAYRSVEAPLVTLCPDDNPDYGVTVRSDIHPHDLKAMLRYGVRCKDLGHGEGARELQCTLRTMLGIHP